ncbi:MAG: Serine phosphatase RsbU, regulator of sigma subunit [uncultured Solirubrobacterales bacterium]|uniref:Serine phosphatase RsbU, regulator of sigma subunit n=1 Tax=uncultured Solirubrobacterales bacterium TaxID=768556 RepID=A0A6J4RSW4_9ACTN|nr:MAG: Serine phosphatase RsbU, regulator of sigma subunit [uncultured Solirubrobacterales bacterium]
MTSRPDRTKRADARRSRAAIIAASARSLREGRRLDAQEIAEAAGVSRATVYRHFPGEAELARGVAGAVLDEASEAVEEALAGDRSLLATLRILVLRLFEIGGRYTPTPVSDACADVGTDEVARRLLTFATRLASTADLQPSPPRQWMAAAVAHSVETCLQLGSTAEDPPSAAEAHFQRMTDEVDGGLVLLDGDGLVVSANARGREAMALADPVAPGRSATPPATVFLYEDGSPLPSEAQPMSRAVRTGEEVGTTVGHRLSDGGTRWYSIEARPLRHRGVLYGFVGLFENVTDRRQVELSQLRPPGELGGLRPEPLDAARALDEVPAPLLPEQIVAEAMRLVGVPVALYVVDIDGSHLLRLAGAEHFPSRLPAPLALGPELAEDGIPDLRLRLEAELPGVAMAPMWLRGRAVGLLLALRASEDRLLELGRQGAAAMELAGRFTDVFDAARRRKPMNPAAELQQSLLPPRITHLGAGEIGGSVLPSYDVGGDWFDYVENRDGSWIAIADAAGKGPTAGGLGSIALAALRAARRNDASLEEAAQTMHETLKAMEQPEFFVTAVIARWNPVYSLFSWINCGHPPPLLAPRQGAVEELWSEPALPLGLFDRKRRFVRSQRRIENGDRLALYSDGISMRRTHDGFFGWRGIASAIDGAPGRSATATARAIQEAVVSASPDPIRDDAAVVVLAP